VTLKAIVQQLIAQLLVPAKLCIAIAGCQQVDSSE
jgi:hypothetical protein